MQSQFSIRCTMTANLMTLAGLMMTLFVMPADCGAQVDTNLPTPLRTAHEFKQDYIKDKPFQYSPCDPFERGKIFRLHTGHYGHFYNCDGEEAKRCSPYIYWKMNDKPALPGHLGPLDAIRCEYAQVKQRIRDGSCAECPTCGQAGCIGCTDAAASACSTCNRAGCRGCGGKSTRRNDAGGCADGNCGNCRECKLRGRAKSNSSPTSAGCATGDCGACDQCTSAREIPNAVAYLESGCATGDCGTCSACSRRGRIKQVASQTTSACGDCGQCSECSRRGRVQRAASPTMSACSSGNCGQCRECNARGLFSKQCASGKCAPDGFRGPRKACAREGHCGCVDTTFDAMAPAGLIYYQPDPSVAPYTAPSQELIRQPEAPAVEPLSGSPAKVTQGGEQACSCAECRLANARQELKLGNAPQRNKSQR